MGLPHLGVRAVAVALNRWLAPQLPVDATAAGPIPCHYSPTHMRLHPWQMGEQLLKCWLSRGLLILFKVAKCPDGCRVLAGNFNVNMLLASR